MEIPRSIKEVIEEFKNRPQIFRFDVFHGEKDVHGNITKSKSIGMAFLKSGEQRYSLTLFTFVDNRFFLLPDRHDPSSYKVLTPTANHSKAYKRKYIWNVVGSGKADTKQGVIEIAFDLFEKPVYLNIFPERSAVGEKIPAPKFLSEAA